MPTLRQSPEGKTLYDCDICGRPWDHLSLAALCEAEGKPAEYPRGLIFGDHTEDSDLPDLTFAVAENFIHGHRNYLMCWVSWGGLRPWDDLPPFRGSACRSSPLGGIDGKIDLKHPGVAVLVKALQAVGIEPMVWNGQKGVRV